MVFYPGTPSTRQISWSQLVREADPNFTRLSLRPWIYDFPNGRLFIDPSPLYDYSFVSEGLGNNNNGSGPGVLFLTDTTGWPTSPDELEGGALWSNGGEPTIVPGFGLGALFPTFFGQTSSAALLAVGGTHLQWTPPPPSSNQLWNPGGADGGPIYVASGTLNLTNLYNDNGVLLVDPTAMWQVTEPTNPGVWSNGGVASVGPGATPDPLAPPIIFGSITAAGLLGIGGFNLPFTTPPAGSLQLWNPGGTSGGDIWIA